MYSHHEESSVVIDAPPEQVFGALDDHRRLSSHMNAPSWRTAGAKMKTLVDEQLGRSVGSHIALRGRVLGIRLFVEEVITAHEPPRRKSWETIGSPRLLVIGPYRMSFEVDRAVTGTHLRVSIDYELPARGIARVLGRLFGGIYARWCTRQMA